MAKNDKKSFDKSTFLDKAAIQQVIDASIKFFVPDALTTSEISKVCGLSQRAVIYLAEKEVVVPSIHDSSGRGSTRIWSFSDMFFVYISKVLQNAGMRQKAADKIIIETQTQKMQLLEMLIRVLSSLGSSLKKEKNELNFPLKRYFWKFFKPNEFTLEEQKQFIEDFIFSIQYRLQEFLYDFSPPRERAERQLRTLHEISHNAYSDLDGIELVIIDGKKPSLNFKKSGIDAFSNKGTVVVKIDLLSILFQCCFSYYRKVVPDGNHIIDGLNLSKKEVYELFLKKGGAKSES